MPQCTVLIQRVKNDVTDGMCSMYLAAYGRGPAVKGFAVMKKIMGMIEITVSLICLSVFFVSCTKNEEKADYPVFGKDKITDIQLVEKGSDSLANWALSDIRSTALVHVSAESSLSRIPLIHIEKMRAETNAGNWNMIKDKQGVLFGNDDYLHAASRLLMIEEIYWVLPYQYFSDIPLARDRIRKLLRASKDFEEDEINATKMEFGCLKGRLSGVYIQICSPRTLPMIKKPVIINIDAGFFPLYAGGLRLSKLAAMKRFFDELVFRKLKVVRIDISYGTEGGNTKAVHRFIGDELFEGISDPEIFRSESPPDLWMYRDEAENMLSGGEDRMVIDYLVKPLQQFPDDTALRMLRAEAKAKAGALNGAFDELNEICERDVHYCYGFVDLGNTLADRKKYDEAEMFFRRAVSSLPDDEYVIGQYIGFLERSGQKAKAESVRKEFMGDQ